MGDRANILVKYENEQVCLYSHWDGSSLPRILQDALNHRERWDDFQYLTRIIFQEMIKDDIGGTDGYGITQTPWDGDDRIITVDVNNQTVNLGAFEELYNDFSFEEYCELVFGE